MKKIFKGTVNGVEYNTVEEYNNAINDALAKGKNITANTSTEIVEEDDNMTISKELFPFNSRDMVEKFVDDAMTASGDVDEVERLASDVLDNIDKDFEKYLNNGANKEKLKDTVNQYLKNAYDYADDLTEQIEEYDKEADELQSQIDELERKMEKIEDLSLRREQLYYLTRDIIDKYEDIFERLDGTPADTECKCDCGCGCNCECKCKQPEQSLTEFDIIDKIKEIISKMK